MKQDINRLTDVDAVLEAGSPVAEELKRLEADTLETDITEKLKRTYISSKHMAESAMPAEVMKTAV